MKCPNCRSEIHSSCLRCPYCNALIADYSGGANRYAVQQTQPVYNNDPRYRNQQYTEPVRYNNCRSGRKNDYPYYNSGYEEYDYSAYLSQGYNQKKSTDLNQILLLMGIVIIGMQVIVLMLLVALLLQV